MNKRTLIYALACGAMVLSGCTKNFPEYNKEQYGVTNEDLKSTPLGGTELETMIKWVIGDQENGWQMYQDLPGVLSGMINTPGFQTQFIKYTPPTGWNDYPYEDTFKNMYKAYNPLLVKLSEDKTGPAYALGQVLHESTAMRLADVYGPIAHSKVTGASLRVPYDTQKEFYTNLLKILRESSEALDASPSGASLYAPYDNVFGGDMHKWATYARSLMLRAAIRISAVEPAIAKEAAEYAVSKGVITTNAQNTEQASADNPLVKTMTNWGDTRVGADIVEYMKAFKDPRIPVYFTPVASRGDIPFGMRGFEDSEKARNVDYSVAVFKEEDPKKAKIMWFSAAEATFLRAEGALLGWNMGGTAKELYEQGIKLSCEQWGVNVGDYLSVTSKRGGFVDPKYPKSNMPDFKSNITVSWDEAAGDAEKQLSKIITQKYIALFPYGAVEAWTEWRRTGYPNLMPALMNNSNGEVKDITQVNGKDQGGMRRLRFTLDERTSNKANVDAAIQDLGGADSYATDLWWVKH